ncbi:AAA family ATPase [Nocardioides sp. P86]|uniref:AAA family ATPase n=1 Tax=Nocardioides sp. P86 TaxID=2939569 RepID=UPI00203B249B|nr:AAA family ATPase [Nocardioides sp. P86]MCM3514621.1 ATP-binding protein [Nocardioides sp. P86]
MSLLLHLNGPPGIGKSALAARWADAHPGTLLLDVDALRTWVGGWREDFAATGEVARPVAHAMVTAHLRGGRDVVLPQLLADPAGLAGFERAAHAAGADVCSVLLRAPAAEVAARRAGRGDSTPLARAVAGVVDGEGEQGPALWISRLEALTGQRPDLLDLDVGGLDEAASLRALEHLVRRAVPGWGA